MIERLTHYILALTERNGRYQLSACNQWVREDEHSTEPTCPTCKQYLLDDSRELSAEDMFGTFDPSGVVKPSYGANADRQRASYRLKER